MALLTAVIVTVGTDASWSICSAMVNSAPALRFCDWTSSSSCSTVARC